MTRSFTVVIERDPESGWLVGEEKIGSVAAPPYTAAFDAAKFPNAVYARVVVHASDGHIGQVEGLVIDPDSHRVTHVVLQEGHLWGRKDVAIPISTVTRVADHIEVSLSKQQVQDLPPVDIDRPHS